MVASRKVGKLAFATRDVGELSTSLTLFSKQVTAASPVAYQED